MARLTSHAAPGRARLTRWSAARLKARVLGALYGWLTLDRVARPEVYDVGPDLFTTRRGPLTTFGTGDPVHACGVVCAPDHPNYRQCFSEAYKGRQGVSGTC